MNRCIACIISLSFLFFQKNKERTNGRDVKLVKVIGADR